MFKRYRAGSGDRRIASATAAVVEAMEERRMLAGDGLLGTYFANQDLTAPYMTRVDPQVNMDWGTGSPDRWKPGDRWSIRWTGSIEAPRTERLTILPTTDDGVRVWINGQLLIDRWTNMSGPTETSLSFDAVAGRRYDVKVEYFEGWGGAVSRLAWSSPTMAKQVIPQQYLYSVPSDQGGVSGPTEDQVAPSVPPNFTSTGKTDTSVALSWGASTDAVGVSGYEVLRGGSVIATLGAAARSYTATGLTANTTYGFAVRAFDAAGNRSATATLSVTTNPPPPAPDTTLPSTPPNFRSTGKDATSVALAWDGSTDNVGVTGYEVLRNGGVIATLGAAVRAYDATGLSASTTYQFGVRAFDAAGNRSATAGLSVTTNAPTTPPPTGTQAPFKGAPFQVGQRIEAEDFDLGGEGVAFHDLDAANRGNTTYRGDGGVDIGGAPNNGRSIDWVQKGEWLEYTLDVPATGDYDLEALTTVYGAGGKFHVEMDGVPVTGSITAPDTRSWNNWQPVFARNVRLTAGRHVMRIVIDENAGGGAYFSAVDYWKWTASTGTTPPPTGTGGRGPDLWIFNHGADAEAVGDNVYSTDPALQRKQQATNFNPSVFHVVIQNDGTTADSFLIKSTHGNVPGWFLRYLDAGDVDWDSGNIITSQIIGGGWQTPVLQPGERIGIRVDVAPQATAVGDTWNAVTFTATSVNDPTRAADTVSAAARFNSSRLVEIRRRNFDASGKYLMDVQNSGNLPSRYRLTAPAGGTGFTARYYDAYFGGNDITAAVTSASGWVTPSIGVKQSQPLRVEVVPTTAGVKSVTLNVQSVEDSFFKDAAVIDNAPPKQQLGHFVIGVWSQPHWSFQNWKNRGINTLMKAENLSGTVSTDYWQQQATAYGFKTIRQPRDNIYLDINDPSLVAWMHNDEPDINQTDPNVLIQKYNYWKQIDPNRPVLINYAGSDVVDWNGATEEHEYQQLFKSADLASSSIYPVDGWGRPDDLDVSGRSMDRLEKWTGGVSQLAIIGSSDSNLPWLPSDIRGATPDEFRAQLWDTVIHGAKGVLYFPMSFTPSFSFDATPPEIVAEMTKQNARLADLGPALMAPTDPSHFGATVDGPLQVTWREYQGKRYFVVLNMSKETVTRSVRLHNTAATAAAVRGENRSVAVNNGVITDSFAPYEMHAYVVG